MCFLRCGLSPSLSFAASSSALPPSLYPNRPPRSLRQPLCAGLQHPRTTPPLVPRPRTTPGVRHSTMDTVTDLVQPGSRATPGWARAHQQQRTAPPVLQRKSARSGCYGATDRRRARSVPAQPEGAGEHRGVARGVAGVLVLFGGGGCDAARASRSRFRCFRPCWIRGRISRIPTMSNYDRRLP
jgi:hypothetical protein